MWCSPKNNPQHLVHYVYNFTKKESFRSPVLIVNSSLGLQLCHSF